MKPLLILILTLSFSFAAFGQMDAPYDNKFCIEIPPLSYVNPVYATPSYQLGCEIKLHNCFSAYLEGGGYFSLNGIGSSAYNQGGRLSNVNGYNGKVEIKYYINKEYISGDYISLEGFYKKQSFNWQDSIHLAPAYLTTFTDFKTVYCITFKYGYLFLFKSGIVIDVYCGLGVRFKNVTSTLNSQQTGALKYSDDSNYDSMGDGETFAPGNEVLPNIEAGFKIGYRIK